MTTIKQLIIKFLLLDRILYENYVCNDINTIVKSYISKLSFKWIIELNKNKIHDLFQYIHHNVEFSHILLNGYPYYQRTNPYNTISRKYRRLPYDKDVKCNCKCYSECQPEIFPTKGDKIKYIIKYDQIDMPHLEELKNEKFYDRLVWHDNARGTLLIGYEKLIIKNISGINDDNRGSNHFKIDLKFHDKVVCKHFITLHDLAKIFFKIKSHKCDRWYELYERVETKINDNIITVEVLFNHGS